MRYVIIGLLCLSIAGCSQKQAPVVEEAPKPAPPKELTPEDHFDIEIDQRLVDMKSMDAPLKSGGTPVLVAAQKGYARSLKLIVLNGAKVAVKDPATGDTPLHIVLSHEAFSGQRERLAMAMIDKRLPPDITNKKKVTPLHLAAAAGEYNVVTALLKHQSDVNAKDQDRNRALHYAARNGHADVVKTLLSRRADKKVQNIFGETPLTLAQAGQGESFTACVNLLK